MKRFPLLDAARRWVRAYAIKPYQDVPVLPTALGKDTGVLGATFLAEDTILAEERSP